MNYGLLLYSLRDSAKGKYDETFHCILLKTKEDVTKIPLPWILKSVIKRAGEK